MIFLLVTLGSGAALFLFSKTLPETGTQAPNFSLLSQEGKTVSLDQFRGKWVVLYFYPKDYTPGCSLEAHNFQRDLSKYDAVNSVIVGVSVDTVESHKGFCTKEGLNFKLLSDRDGSVSKAYGSLNNLGIAKFASRHTFLIDPKGKIVKVYPSVTASRHSDDVLNDLAQLQKK